MATCPAVKALLYAHDFSCYRLHLIPGVQGGPVAGRGVQTQQLAEWSSMQGVSTPTIAPANRVKEELTPQQLAQPTG